MTLQGIPAQPAKSVANNSLCDSQRKSATVAAPFWLLSHCRSSNSSRQNSWHDIARHSNNKDNDNDKSNAQQTKRDSTRASPSVRVSVRLCVRPTVCPSVCPFVPSIARPINQWQTHFSVYFEATQTAAAAVAACRRRKSAKPKG